MHNLWKDQDRKVHFKMYKAGKQWVFAGLAVIGLSAGLSMSGGNVRADSNVEGSVPQTEKAVVTDPTPAVVDKTAALPTTELKQAATAPTAEKASDPQAVQAVGETQTASDTAAAKAPAENVPADPKADGNVSPTAARPVQDKKAENKSVDEQVEPYKSDTEKNTTTTTKPLQSDDQPDTSSHPQVGASEPDNNSQQTVGGLQVQADDAKAIGTTAKNDIPDGPGVVTVTPATFPQYFKRSYYTDWYPNTGTTNLTWDQKSMTGNVTLKTKMYMGDSFQLKGAVMLGNHGNPETDWADGITFGFNSSPVGAVGHYGSDLGMGGLQNGFGFKLDTYSNPERDDPLKFYKDNGKAYGQDGQNHYPRTDAFGAFAYNAKDNTYRTYNPQSETDPAAPKSLGYGQLKPNTFYPIEIDYDGKSHVMTATFDNTTSGKTLTWSHDVSAWAGNKKALSFIISASTGELYGKQMFQLKSFKYTVSGIANVKFVDEDNNPIPNAPSVSEVYGRLGEATELTDATAAIQKIESGGQYYFDRAVRTGTGHFDVNKNQLTMTKEPQDITYYFAKSQTAIKANDFTMYTGQPWSSDLKNVVAIAKEGTHLLPSDIQVTSKGDNQTPGTYDVTYTVHQYGYQGGHVPSVSKTVHATVIASKSKIDVQPLTFNVGDKFDPAKALTSVTDTFGKPVPLDDKSLSNTISDTTGHEIDPDKVTSHSGTYDIQFTYKPNGKVLSTSPKAKITVVQPDNVTVNLVNVKNDQTVNTDVPKNHQTDDQIDVTANSPYLKTVIPDGYHYATAGDFTADKVTDKAQPATNPTYTAKKQTVTVYVAGDTIKPGDANAFTLHDYLKDSNDVKVGKDVSLGGNVGDTVVATVDAAKKAALPGYTIVPGQSDQSWVLQSKKGSTANFYFTADPQSNITVNVVNAKNDHTLSTDQPTDHHTGDTLDVSQNSSFVQAVKEQGYHYATGSELNGHAQLVKDPVYDTTPKNVNIYVAGDRLTDVNALKIHYLKDGTWVSIRPDLKIGGNVGDEIHLPLNDSRLVVPGYKLAPNQKDVKWVLNNSDGQGQPFFYNPESQDNITVHFLDVNNDNLVGNPVNPQGQTGDELNLTKTSTQIHVPEGYHWATDADLKSNQKTQLPELKWTVDKQDANVYVNGDSIADKSENALTIDHYLVDDNGKPTSKTIGTPVSIGGRVGQTITINPQDVKYAEAGYTPVGKSNITRTLGRGKVDPVSLYYAANSTSNITVRDIDVNGDPNKPVWTNIPTGKTGEKLDLNDNKNLNIPAGYHKATGDELNGHTQPADPTYSKTEQTVNVYVAGDMVPNAITVHHLRQDEQGKPTKLTIAPDNPLNIRFGQTYSVDLSKEPQKVNGYTIVPNQVVKPVKVGLNTHEDVNVYYTGDEASNINVHLIDTNVNGTKFKVQVPAGHTGEVLNLDDKSKVQIPDGYHRSNKSEMPAGESQSNNPTYTTKEQNVHVYVTGNPIDKKGANALIINHYLADEKGQPTSQSFGTPIRIGGYVGEKISVDPQSKNYQIDGYTALGKDTIIRTLGTKPVDPVSLYYQANGLSNITVHYLDVNNDNQVGDPVNPEGHTGEILNLGETSTQIHVPEGYHFATNDELKEHQKTQVHELKWGTQKQDANVYVNGNPIDKDSQNALVIDHYLADEKGRPTLHSIGTQVRIPGRVGETKTVNPLDKDNQIAGYTVTSKEKVTRTLGTKPVDPVKLYYRANGLSNITVHYLDINNDDKQVGDSVNPEGHTDETLKLDKTSTQLHVPEGYHFATNDELKEHQKTQVHELTWGTQDQNANVYVSGNTIDRDSANALTVDHYLADEKGQPTSTTIGTPVKIGGHVGETLQVDPMGKENLIAGYTVTSKAIVTRTLGNGPVDPVKLYYTGNAVENAVTVHHLRQDEQGKPTKVTVTSDTSLPGTVGQTLAVDLSKEPQKVNGYTIVPNQVVKPVKVGLNTHEDVNIYYTGDEASNINVHLIDTHHNGTKFNPETPQGHTGEVLNLNDNSKVQIPDGYHRSDKSEIPAGESQSPNPTYTTSEQNVHVYVTGNNIDDTDANALTVNHYIQDGQGQKTTKSIGTVGKIGGYVGKPVKVDPQANENTIPGYTPVDKNLVTRVLTTKPQSPVDLYYTANELNNITVKDYDVNGDPNKPVSVNVPTGKTGEKLDLNDNKNLNIPAGYHKATGTELNGHTQPENPTYSTTPKTVNVFVVGDDVNDAVIVHYTVQDKTGKSSANELATDKINSKVGQTVTVNPSGKQPTFDGYTIVPNQAKQQIVVTPDTHKEVTIYYTGDANSHVIVHLVDTDSGNTIATDKPEGHTGETLDLNDNSKVAIPDGYHRADKDELPAGKQQSDNPTYTTKDQDVDVYVTGDDITTNDANAVTVHHYLTGTTHPVHADTKVGGRVGQTVEIDPQSGKNAVEGYTPDANQSVQLRTLGTKPVSDVNIYYTPNASNNITIQYVDGSTGKVVATTTPKGYYGNKVDLTNPSVVKAPKGYHLATANELPKGKQQPSVNPTFSNKDQKITIYVFGDYTGNGGTTGGSGVVVPTKTTDQPKVSTPANPVVEAPATNDAAPKAQTRVVKKGEVVYSLKNIYLYKNKTFSKKERKAGYVSKPRVYRPMFVVIGHSYSKNGLLRYKVRDVNHLTKNRHLVGYITANFDYVRPVYYQGKHQTITVINPRGVNGYKRKDLTGHSAKYKQGTVLHVAKVVHHNLTTRYVLTNGQYITANRKLVMTGKKKMPRTIRVKRTINRYKDANFTYKNKKRIQRGAKLKVLGYDYSHANSVSKHGTLRYRVAGGYVTGNSKFVKVHY